MDNLEGKTDLALENALQRPHDLPMVLPGKEDSPDLWKAAGLRPTGAFVVTGEDRPVNSGLKWVLGKGFSVVFQPGQRALIVTGKPEEEEDRTLSGLLAEAGKHKLEIPDCPDLNIGSEDLALKSQAEGIWARGFTSFIHESEDAKKALEIAGKIALLKVSEKETKGVSRLVEAAKEVELEAELREVGKKLSKDVYDLKKGFVGVYANGVEKDNTIDFVNPVGKVIKTLGSITSMGAVAVSAHGAADMPKLVAEADITIQQGLHNLGEWEKDLVEKAESLFPNSVKKLTNNEGLSVRINLPEEIRIVDDKTGKESMIPLDSENDKPVTMEEINAMVEKQNGEHFPTFVFSTAPYGGDVVLLQLSPDSKAIDEIGLFNGVSFASGISDKLFGDDASLTTIATGKSGQAETLGVGGDGKQIGFQINLDGQNGFSADNLRNLMRRMMVKDARDSKAFDTDQRVDKIVKAFVDSGKTHLQFLWRWNNTNSTEPNAVDVVVFGTEQGGETTSAILGSMDANTEQVQRIVDKRSEMASLNGSGSNPVTMLDIVGVKDESNKTSKTSNPDPKASPTATNEPAATATEKAGSAALEKAKSEFERVRAGNVDDYKKEVNGDSITLYDKEGNKIYEGNKNEGMFELRFARKILSDFWDLLPTKYYPLPRNETTPPNSPTNKARTELLIPLFAKVRGKIDGKVYQGPPFNTKELFDNGQRGNIAIMLNPEINAWGVVSIDDIHDMKSKQILGAETKDHEIVTIQIIPWTMSDIIRFWFN